MCGNSSSRPAYHPRYALIGLIAPDVKVAQGAQACSMQHLLTMRSTVHTACQVHI